MIVNKINVIRVAIEYHTGPETESKLANQNSWINSLSKVTLDNKFLIRNSP